MCLLYTISLCVHCSFTSTQRLCVLWCQCVCDTLVLMVTHSQVCDAITHQRSRSTVCMCACVCMYRLDIIQTHQMLPIPCGSMLFIHIVVTFTVYFWWSRLLCVQVRVCLSVCLLEITIHNFNHSLASKNTHTKHSESNVDGAIKLKFLPDFFHIFPLKVDFVCLLVLIIWKMK